MTQIIAGRINWIEHYNNVPVLELLVDRVPTLSEHRYEKRGTVYYSELNGVCSFFSWSGRPDYGYGGRAFELNMQDGSTETLVGPWSCSASAVSSIGFGPCVEVSMTDEHDAYKRGYTFYAGSVTMELLNRYKHVIETPPYRYRMDDPWCCSTKGFSHRLVFPEGSSFTMLENEGVRHEMQASGQQAQALGYLPRFVPIVQLPNGKYWLKPLSWHVPMVVPEGIVIEEIVK